MSQLYIIAAPSGAGKSSLVSQLMKLDDRLQLSISHTTREPREGEQDGVHYHFIKEDEFLTLVKQNAFLEYAKVFDHYYGTTAKSIHKQLTHGFDSILEIDWQGAKQVRQVFPSVKTIFILPPSIEALQERLEQRGQDTQEVIQKRMQKAKAEISHYPEFDYVVINDDFDNALLDLQYIFYAQRLKCQRQTIKNKQLLHKLLN